MDCVDHVIPEIWTHNYIYIYIYVYTANFFHYSFIWLIQCHDMQSLQGPLSYRSMCAIYHVINLHHTTYFLVVKIMLRRLYDDGFLYTIIYKFIQRNSI